MELAAAEALAAGLMARHGLRGWTFGWDRAVRRAGAAHFRDRRITLSRKLTALHDEAQVRDTVLHEIAHALVGPGHGHDATWRRQARAIGCTGERCLDDDAPRVEGRWVGTCPAGHTTTRHRTPTRVLSCRRCSASFDLRHVYSWTRDGAPAPAHPVYEAELRRLRRSDPGAAGRRDPATSAARPVLPEVGSRVVVTAGGRYRGRPGTVVAVRRTRCEVRLADGTRLLAGAGAVEALA